MFFPREPTVRGLWAYMQDRYGSTVVANDTFATRKALGLFLDVIGVQNIDEFMRHLTVTLMCTVYVPFVISVENACYDLWRQILACVHEHQHVVQGNRDGWSEYSTDYLSSSQHRAKYEAEAFGCNLEMEYWRNPRVDLCHLVNEYTRIVSGYGCTADDVESVRRSLLMRSGVVASGGVESEVVRRATIWLEKETK